MKSLNSFNTILKRYLIILLFLGTNIYGGLMEYKIIDKKKSIFGTLNFNGSSYTEKLIREWALKFQELYPNVKSIMYFNNSKDGIKALIDSTANIGVSSREINKKERDKFKEKNGYAPTEIKISINALAIYVNRENKVNKITLPQLDAIFSNTLNRDYKNKIENWKDINGIDSKIDIYLYDKNSTTLEYFKKNVMMNGEFSKKNIVTHENRKFLNFIDEVALNMNGICFANIGTKNYKVKALLVSKKENFPSYKPTLENIKNNKYPLIRFSYIYLDLPPDKPIPKVIYEFCKYILSKDAQEIVSNMGGLTLSPKQVGIELSKIRR